MLGLFVTLGIAILTLIIILLWFVPHLLQRQAQQAANESAQLREMLLDILSEQEVVTVRQGQLGTSVFYLQEQLEQIVHHSSHADVLVKPSAQPHGVESGTGVDYATLHKLEQRLNEVQMQIETFMDTSRHQSKQDNESWAYLLGLLSSMMERIGELSAAQPTEPAYMMPRADSVLYQPQRREKTPFSQPEMGQYYVQHSRW